MLVKNDVRFDFNDVSYFVKRFQDSTYECLLARFVVANHHWPWFKSTHDFGIPVYRCQFPLVYARRSVIEYAFQKRLEISKLMTADFLTDNTRWPNDESFFASSVKLGGFRVGDFNELEPVHSMATFCFDPPFLEDEYSGLLPDDRIYHPVLDLDRYCAKLLRNRAFATNSKLIAAELDKLVRLGFSRDLLDPILKHHL